MTRTKRFIPWIRRAALVTVLPSGFSSLIGIELVLPDAPTSELTALVGFPVASALVIAAAVVLAWSESQLKLTIVVAWLVACTVSPEAYLLKWSGTGEPYRTQYHCLSFASGVCLLFSIALAVAIRREKLNNSNV